MNWEIKIGFSSPRSFFVPYSWAIKLFQGWRGASHVYLEFKTPQGTEMVYQASGSQTNYMSKNLFNKIAKTEETFTITVSKNKYRELTTKFGESAGTPYSWKQAFGILLIPIFKRNIFKDGKKAQICTELAAYTLQECGIKIKNPESLTPRQLYDICCKELPSGDS